MANPDLTPIIAGAPSIQVCLKFLSAELVGFKKGSTRVLTSAAVVVDDSVLLNKNSFFIFLVSGEGDQVAFQNAIARLVQMDASLERALLDFGANLPAHINSHIVNSSANGVIRE